MHIPDGFLTGEAAALGTVTAVAGLGRVPARRRGASMREKDLPLAGLAAAFFLVARGADGADHGRHAGASARRRARRRAARAVAGRADDRGRVRDPGARARRRRHHDARPDDHEPRARPGLRRLSAAAGAAPAAPRRGRVRERPPRSACCSRRRSSSPRSSSAPRCRSTAPRSRSRSSAPTRSIAAIEARPHVPDRARAAGRAAGPRARRGEGGSRHERACVVRRRRAGRGRPAHAARRARARRGGRRRLGALARRPRGARARAARARSWSPSDDKTFDDVLAIYRRAADEGLGVARVHSGDPTLYGTLNEQLARVPRARARRARSSPASPRSAPPRPRSGRS